MGIKNIEKSRPNRIIGLDILRILLAIVVFMFHSSMHFSCNYGYLDPLAKMGAVTMTGFFMLSGYVLVITSLSKDLSSSLGIRNFYKKRFVSILPLYYVVAFMFMIYNGVCDYLFVGSLSSFVNELILLPIEVLGIQTVFPSLSAYSHNGGTWFISCMIMCYIIFPLFYTIASKFKLKVLGVCSFMFFLLLLWSAFVQYRLSLNGIYDNPFFRILEFCIGGCLSLISCNNVVKRKLYSFDSPLFFFCVVLLFATSIVLVYNERVIPDDTMCYDFIVIPLFAILLSLATVYRGGKCANSHLIQYLSKISFSFYMFQVLPIWVVSHKLIKIIGHDSNIIRIGVSFFVCLLGAVLLYELIEKRLTSFLKKFQN